MLGNNTEIINNTYNTENYYNTIANNTKEIK